ncbi:MAG: hypothetical protein ACOYXY_02405 [Thermodesulfobacteriota bacterium]
MTAPMMLREARSKDTPAIKKILSRWLQEETLLNGNLEGIIRNQPNDPASCRVVEDDKAIRAVSLWTREGSSEVRLLGFGSGGPPDQDLEQRLLHEEILDWCETGVSRVTVDVPEPMSADLVPLLKSCGFLYEGMSSGWSISQKPLLKLSKHFLYRTVPQKELMAFLMEFMISCGYEVLTEEGGFRYRVRQEFTRPFIFSPWHRITTSGSEILIHPPARVIERHELEELFYPMRIYSPAEKPLLLFMEKKRARTIVDLPSGDARQNSLFQGNMRGWQKPLRRHNLTYSHPVGLKTLRKGLPLLFYVNGTGAVGSGRVEDWYLDEPENLFARLREIGEFDPADVKEHAATSGPRMGKVLVIRFCWYRPLKRAVTLEEIRAMDLNFNPPRTRSLSSELFQSVLAQGNDLA